MNSMHTKSHIFSFIQTYNAFWLYILELLNLPKSHFRPEQLSISIYKIQNQKFWKESQFYHLIVVKTLYKKFNQHSRLSFPPPTHAHRVSINNCFPDSFLSENMNNDNIFLTYLVGLWWGTKDNMHESFCKLYNSMQM